MHGIELFPQMMKISAFPQIVKISLLRFALAWLPLHAAPHGHVLGVHPHPTAAQDSKEQHSESSCATHGLQHLFSIVQPKSAGIFFFLNVDYSNLKQHYRVNYGFA